jgi:hypothetical protein
VEVAARVKAGGDEPSSRAREDLNGVDAEAGVVGGGAVADQPPFFFIVLLLKLFVCHASQKG